MAPKKKPKLKVVKPAKPKPEKKQSRKEASSPVPALGANEYAEKLDVALTELFDLQARMDADMAGYRGDFNNSYEAHAKSLGIRQTVLKEEFRRALANKKRMEKERAMDAVERAQREALRNATLNLQLDGLPMADWFKGELAKPAQTDEEVEEEEADEKGAA